MNTSSLIVFFSCSRVTLRLLLIDINIQQLLLFSWTCTEPGQKCVCVCVLQVLERGGPYPQVILPEFGGYWIENPEAPPPLAPPPASLESSGEEEEGGALGGGEEEEESPPGDYGYQLEEINEAARAYRRHFLGRVRLEGVVVGRRFYGHRAP